MKKNRINYFILPLLLAVITGCTQEPITMDAGKLPDEAAMAIMGGVLRSERTLTNKVAINLEEEDESASDIIYYMLSQPAASAVTVTAVADEKLVGVYNAANGTGLEALPAANVQFEGGGSLSVAVGKQHSARVKMTISAEGLEPGTVYLLPLTIAQAPSGVQAQAEKQVIYYGVRVREKIRSIYPIDPYWEMEYPPMLPDVISVFYVNTETYQPLIADVYGLMKMSYIDWSMVIYNIGNIVNLKKVTVDYDSDTKRALLNLGRDLQDVLERADKFIRPLQDHERQVCLCIENGGKGIGFSNMNDVQIVDFVQQVKDVIELYNLDGVNLWDEGNGYGKEGMPPVNTTSYPRLIKALREALPGKLVTLVDKGEPTGYFYDVDKCGGIEVGKYIDYAWHGYVNENEKVQIIEPWASDHPYSEYTRKPIAGLTSDRYGSVNIPRYPNTMDPGEGEGEYRRIIRWRVDNRKRSNVLVYGTDLTANEQSQYEGMVKAMISATGYFMDDGPILQKSPWSDLVLITDVDCSYTYQAMDYLLDGGYKIYAKGWERPENY